MSRIRQKLERLHAPRPTRLPDGAEVVSIPAPGARSPEPGPPVADRQAADGSSEAAHRSSDVEPVIAGRSGASERADEPPATANPDPVRRGAARPAKGRAHRAAKTRRPLTESENLPPRFEETAPAERPNPLQPTGVVRRGDFEAWREQRRARSIATLRDQVPAHVDSVPIPTGVDRGSAANDQTPSERPAPAEPTSPHGFFERAIGAMARRDWAAADADLRTAVDGLSGRERWTALKQLATLALDRDEISEAERWLRQMVATRGTSDPFALVELATLLDTRGEKDEAAELMERARKLAPWLRG